MKGFPKKLNSKADYEYIRKNFPEEQWRPAWEALIKESKAWFFTAALAEKSAGIEDETHYIVESKDLDGETKYLQYELMEDKSSDMVRLGFTVEEIEKALGAD